MLSWCAAQPDGQLIFNGAGSATVTVTYAATHLAPSVNMSMAGTMQVGSRSP